LETVHAIERSVFAISCSVNNYASLVRLN